MPDTNWLGVDLDTHVAMVEAWLAGAHLPARLGRVTIAWPRDEVGRLLA